MILWIQWRKHALQDYSYPPFLFQGLFCTAIRKSEAVAKHLPGRLRIHVKRLFSNDRILFRFNDPVHWQPGREGKLLFLFFDQGKKTARIHWRNDDQHHLRRMVVSLKQLPEIVTRHLFDRFIGSGNIFADRMFAIQGAHRFLHQAGIRILLVAVQFLQDDAFFLFDGIRADVKALSQLQQQPQRGGDIRILTRKVIGCFLHRCPCIDRSAKQGKFIHCVAAAAFKHFVFKKVGGPVGKGDPVALVIFQNMVKGAAASSQNGTRRHKQRFAEQNDIQAVGKDGAVPGFLKIFFTMLNHVILLPESLPQPASASSPHA